MKNKRGFTLLILNSICKDWEMGSRIICISVWNIVTWTHVMVRTNTGHVYKIRDKN